LAKKGILVLEDGSSFVGKPFGAMRKAVGEVVFNTSMFGYQEILTDSSYKGQMVVMTYPLIGVVGINYEDLESQRPAVEAFLVREYQNKPSNWRSRKTLDEYLTEQDIPGLEQIDTRALTIHLRNHGAMMGIIGIDCDEADLLRQVREAPRIDGRDLVSEVTCKRSYSWAQGNWNLDGGYVNYPRGVANDGSFEAIHRIIAMDFGIKYNILRQLTASGCEVEVVPAHMNAEKIMAKEPDGIFLSNGPGDPEGVPYAIETVRKLLMYRPIFGICLGHQILGLALGGRTYKLKFGHHGGNQPVKNLSNGKIEITAQNHNYVVDIDSIGSAVELTHTNCNDGTVEGMKHTSLPIFSVQYHPEASPGPHDSHYLFKQFTQMVAAWKKT